MREYKVRIQFDKENGVTVKVESDSEINALYHVTAHKEWFYPTEDLAIDMRKVTHVCIKKPVRIASSRV